MLTKKANSNIRIAVFVLFIAGLVFSILRPSEETLCEARINKQIVGYAANRSEIVSMIDKIEADLSEQYFVEQLSPYYEAVFSDVEKGELSETGYEDLKRNVLANQKYVTPGYELSIDGKVYATAKNESDLEFLLDNVKSRLKNDHESIQSVDFMEDVKISPGNIFLRDSISQSESDLLVERLLTGREQIESYTVKSGDTLTAIASSQGLSVGDIAAANPGTDIDKIYIGQKLFLSKPAPILHRK